MRGTGDTWPKRDRCLRGAGCVGAGGGRGGLYKGGIRPEKEEWQGRGRDEGRAGVPIWGGNSQIEAGDLQKDSPRAPVSRVGVLACQPSRIKRSCDWGCKTSLV